MPLGETRDALRVALVGAGEVGTALLRLLFEEPSVTVVGVADVKPDAPGVIFARERGIPTTLDPRHVFSFRPTVVIECTGDLTVFQDLSSLKPLGTELIGGSGFCLMWRLLASREYAFRGLSALHSTTTAVGALLDLPKVLETALTEAMALTHARRGLLQLLDPDSQEEPKDGLPAAQQAVSEPGFTPGERAKQGTGRHPVLRSSIAVKAHRGFSQRFLREISRLHFSETTGAKSMADVALVSVEAEPDERWRAALMEEGVRYYALVPLRARDRLFGMMLLADPPVKNFTSRQQAWLKALGIEIGAAAGRACLFEESERRAREQAALNAIATVTSQSRHLDALLQTVLDKVLEVAECEKGFIRLKDPRSGEISLGAHQNISEEYLTALRTGRSGRRSEEVIESGEPIVIDNPEGEGLSQALRDQDIRSVAWIPLKARSTVVGVLNVSATRARSFAPREVEFLQAVGKMIGVAIDNARLFEKVESAYAELQATQQQLVQAETLRALGQMAGGVAHDFNNLLAAILGRAQILHREVNDVRARKGLEVIEQAARDGAETVRRIQEFTRVRQDRPPGPVDVNRAINDALELTRTRWKDEVEKRGVRVEISTSFGTLPPVLGIAAELKEVLINLILNAVDAMPAGGRLAIATVGGVDRPGVGAECVAIEVRDTGAGIPEDQRHRIFEPFFTTKGPQSSGLGLSVAFGIIARHHGKIEVESEAGQGTTFRILLPVTEIPAREPATPEIRSSPRGLLCLVIDDEEHVRDVLADALTGEGHLVKAVATASEGLQALGQCAYDIVFTDLGMPGMTGWEVGQAVKTLRPGTPVVLVTGWSVRLDPEERARSGIRAVLAKPFEMKQLFALLREIIPTRVAF